MDTDTDSSSSTTHDEHGWRRRLIALGLGMVIVAVVFGATLMVSEDLRLLYLNGAFLLVLVTFWFGSKRRSGWIDLLFMYLPVAAVFSWFVLPELPFLWLNLALWALAAALVFSFRRAGIKDSARVFATILFVAVSVWYCMAYIPRELKRVANRMSDSAAQPFVLQPVSDGPVPTSATPGKIMVIDFFGTWCPPCLGELPELERVRMDLRDRHDIDLVIVGTPSGGDTPEKLRMFGHKHQLTLPLAFDPEGKARQAFGVKGFPGVVVIDRTGHVRLTRVGYNSSETTFREDLVGLLRSL